MEVLDRIKQRAEKRRASIQAKVHPTLAPILHAYGEARKAREAWGDNPPPGLAGEIEARLRKKLEQVAQAYPEIPLVALALVHPGLREQEKPVDEGSAFAETIHFNRHLKPLVTDIQAANAGDREALKRTYRTTQDVLALRFGQGPLKPYKANLDHIEILLSGWGMGLEKLTHEELTDFFDQNCWCGEPHDADSLRKQATRLVKQLSAEAI